jgi:hypothetical protein
MKTRREGAQPLLSLRLGQKFIFGIIIGVAPMVVSVAYTMLEPSAPRFVTKCGFEVPFSVIASSIRSSSIALLLPVDTARNRSAA